jgi:hypothetical protein
MSYRFGGRKPLQIDTTYPQWSKSIRDARKTGSQIDTTYPQTDRRPVRSGPNRYKIPAMRATAAPRRGDRPPGGRSAFTMRPGVGASVMCGRFTSTSRTNPAQAFRSALPRRFAGRMCAEHGCSPAKEPEVVLEPACGLCAGFVHCGIRRPKPHQCPIPLQTTRTNQTYIPTPTSGRPIRAKPQQVKTHETTRTTPRRAE